jgi:site-specific DNA-methyltransferase (adenine-specific)
MPISTVECCDCMDFMAQFPDKFFDLAIVDPPYGIGVNQMNMGGRNTIRPTTKKWDDSIPNPEYFKELFRVSKEQIIWGGNYFPLRPSRCFAIWDKGESMYGRDFAECEMAWVSMDKVARIFKRNPVQLKRIHPTQKPVRLYQWLLTNYAKPGDKILDTHMGSQSSRIAAYQMGFDFWGCEIDPEYFADGCKRFEKETEQLALFTSEITTREQNKLFEEGLG